PSSHSSEQNIVTTAGNLESSGDSQPTYLSSATSELTQKEEQNIGTLPIKADELIVENSNEESSITNLETIETPKSLFKENETPVYAEVTSSPPSSFAYDNAKKDKMSLKNKLRNLKFSIDASTYMNFSDAGFNDDINVAVGLVSEYQITRNLSINSGINVNRQSSSFTQEVPAPQDNMQNAMALTNSIASVVNGQFTNAKLVGLDIPLNIRYSTANKKLNW